MNTYCLFCETAKCDFVVNLAERLFPCSAIYPRTVQHLWVRRKPVDAEHPLTPGYVFLYAKEPLEAEKLQALQGVIKCLRNHDQRCELSGSDEQFALMLLRKNGVIGKTPVHQEGQRIRIREGAFAGVETKILRIDRRSKRMQIEIPFASMQVKTWVEYEIMEDAEADRAACSALPRE